MTIAVEPSLKAVLFADVVGSTALYRKLGNERAEGLIRRALDRVIASAQRQGGRLIKTIGDCALCEFPTANSAAHAAFETQRTARVPVSRDDEPVLFRIGFVSGPVVPRDNDIFGDAVNVAARLCDIAKAEQVLTTEATAHELDVDLRATMRLFDHTPVKGVTESLSIVQLLWDRRPSTQIFVFPKEAESLLAGGVMTLQYAGRSITLAAAQMPYTIGREEGCGLIVPSPCSSREHAKIEMRRGKFTLVDESTNGTYVLPEGVAPEKAVYIRREAFTLLGRGVFALGERPVAGLEHLLSYELR